MTARRTTKEPTPEEVAAFTDSQGNPLTEEDVKAQKEEEKRIAASDSPITTLTDVDLTDPKTGNHAPLSAVTENLQGTIENRFGRPLIKVSTRGYIGEEPVAILAKDVDEFRELLDALEEAAVAQKKTFSKASE